jgi:hypothetical protein
LHALALGLVSRTSTFGITGLGPICAKHPALGLTEPAMTRLIYVQ